ncbi:Uncharacterised protein [Slackia heliotrinireducens]|uniref:Nif11 domain-containing protein n=1 Tax=Slackia heliotrinireducens (strain ATCC 29202 / DSM 20476 / NCTC 11029 / RHS 1) TaxID=471855 RepID=C7N282_SLAHD|nr:hypothetical protein [Slackia heliotrinireducens]ACV21388.1 hypothetical protein Shel_03210 [Slackia heliotrinireducens DSM 20476]VEG98821.1 Uncharacterised protein [Slackia heliotrinireducens]
MKLEDFDLTAEQMEKAKACETPEELLALAKQEGIELSEEQLEGISGGADWGCSGFLSSYAY